MHPLSMFVLLVFVLGISAPSQAQSWTTPWTATTGKIVTAAQLNETRDNLTVLRTGSIAIASQAANEVIYASSATQFSRSANLKFTGTDLQLASSRLSFSGTLALGTGPAIGQNGTELFFIGGTTGFIWRDNANVNNRMTLSDAGLLAVGGFGTHTFNSGGTGLQTLQVRNTTAGATNAAVFYLGQDADAALGVFQVNSSTFTTSGVLIASSLAVISDGANGLSIAARNAAGPIRIYSGGSTETARFFASRGVSIGDTTDPGATNFRVAGTTTLVGAIAGNLSNTARYNSATLQPGFLAYNSAADTLIGNNSTVDFDTEVYDEAGNFAADIFTAPVTGRYLFTIAVETSAGTVVDTRFARLVTSNRTYNFDVTTPSGAGDIVGISGAVIADMDTSDTAEVTLGLASGTVTIAGGAGPQFGTFFSGRLLP